MGVTIVRAQVLHTPRNPFEHDDALEAADALVFEDGRILALGDRGDHPDAEVIDARDAYLLPGLVDTHVHWPQLGVIGAMGMELLDWLRHRTLPEEARLKDPAYARPLARDFLRALATSGTTTALVFGSHFPKAQDTFFEEAQRSGLRVASGLVVSDRDLLAPLHTDPQTAHDAGLDLARRWHGVGRLRYAVTPRFSLSCSEAMLESCAALGAEVEGALVTTHVNENLDEVRAVAERFPAAEHYLDTYDRHGLVGPATVVAHNVHATDAELGRLSEARAGVAHCASSNACLGSGIFPLRRHLDRGVRVALGTDVGAGAGLSLLGEAAISHMAQMLAPGGVRMTPAHLLWLATRAGADLLGMGDQVGDLSPGKSADYVLIRPPAGGGLAATLARSESLQDALGAIFALAREESVADVRVAGGDNLAR